MSTDMSGYGKNTDFLIYQKPQQPKVGLPMPAPVKHAKRSYVCEECGGNFTLAQVTFGRDHKWYCKPCRRRIYNQTAKKNREIKQAEEELLPVEDIIQGLERILS